MAGKARDLESRVFLIEIEGLVRNKFRSIVYLPTQRYHRSTHRSQKQGSTGRPAGNARGIVMNRYQKEKKPQGTELRSRASEEQLRFRQQFDLQDPRPSLLEQWVERLRRWSAERRTDSINRPWPMAS